MTAASVYAALATLPSEEQARFHLRAVLPEILGHESIEIRCLNANALPPRKGPRVFVSGIDEAVEAAMTMRRDWDVFFGVGTRTCPDGRTMKHCAHQEKGKDHVARLACMWGDFDTHSKSFDDVRGELEALALPPDVLVASGRGLHAYWKLTEATTDFKTIEGLNRSLRLRFGVLSMRLASCGSPARSTTSMARVCPSGWSVAMYELTQLQDEFLVAEAQPEAAVHSVQGDGLLSAPAAAWPA